MLKPKQKLFSKSTKKATLKKAPKRRLVKLVGSRLILNLSKGKQNMSVVEDLDQIVDQKFVKDQDQIVDPKDVIDPIPVTEQIHGSESILASEIDLATEMI